MTIHWIQMGRQLRVFVAVAEQCAPSAHQVGLSDRHASSWPHALNNPAHDKRLPPSRFTPLLQPTAAPAKQRSMASVHSARSGRPSGRGSGGLRASGKVAAPAIEELVDLVSQVCKHALQSPSMLDPPGMRLPRVLQSFPTPKPAALTN